MKRRISIVITSLTILLLILGIYFYSSINNFELVEKQIIITEGKTTKIEIKDNKNIAEYDFIGYDKSIVNIDSSGTLLALKKGKTTVRVKNRVSGKYKRAYIRVDERKVSKLYIGKSIINLTKGDKYHIEYVLEYKTSDSVKVTFESTDKDIITVDDKGNVETVDVGIAEIIVRTDDGALAKVQFNVYDTIDSIKLNKEKITIEKGKKEKLVYTISPMNVLNTDITRSSSNKDIVEVINGELIAHKTGKAKITVTTSNNKKSECIINVVSPMKKLELNTNNVNIKVGYTYTLKTKVTPSDTTDKISSWTSSNTNVVTVSNGKIIARNVGSAKITVKSSNGLSYTTNVNVTSNTKGKSSIFFGDSITYGAITEGYSWANYIGENYDLSNIKNAGKSGWCVSECRTDVERYLVNNVKLYNGSNYDYVILSGGTNDIYYGIPLGSYVYNDFSGNYNTKTILGGLESYIYTVKHQWPNAKIGYVFTYATPNSNKNRRENTVSTYNKMKKVLKKWNIPYLDLCSDTSLDGVKYSVMLDVYTKKYLADNVHLNIEGYNLISPYIYMWMNTI